MNRLRYGVALCALALAACGGDGGSAPPPATGGGAGGGGGTPTPTPTPSAITYTAFNDLTGNQTFSTACAIGANATQAIGFSIFSDTGGITYSFAEADETWTNASNGTFGEFSETFGPADIIENAPGVRTFYQRLNPAGGLSDIFVFGAPQWPTASADYVRGSFFQSSDGGGFNCVFGVPTVLEDDLPSTTITYSQEIDAAGTLVNFPSQSGAGFGPTAKSFDLSPSTFTVTANPTTGVVSISADIRGFEFTFDANGNRIDGTEITEFGTMTGDAQVTDTEQTLFADMFNPSAVNFLANASGWFFGPQGEEIGIVFSGSQSQTDGSVVSFSFGITAQVDL